MENKEEQKNQLIQIIDGNGDFTPLDQLAVLFNKWDLLKKAFDYHVVAILGAQSSGKSTLLNLLFGTTFPVMTSQEGRTQTTLGVWAGLGSSKSEKEEAILVMDVEGTDSRERGDDAASFERKTSLFSLALSEVLIVNIWHNDIGRYNAGNIALLKTVFELNLQLFQKTIGGPKTRLLFVIRDHIPKETPLAKLQIIIMTDMHQIWEGLIKPAQFAHSKAEDFFDFLFTALPHKVLVEEEFNKEVAVLRKRFIDPKEPGFLLRENFRTDIPADGFAPYAERIWATIKENKDLDLPSQKEMLAMYRCDEILNEAYKNFSTKLLPTKKSIEKGELVENFGKTVSVIFNEALAEYDEPSSRYHAEVAAKKRQMLSSNMSTELETLYTKILQKLIEKSFSKFQKSMTDGLPKDGTASTDFITLKNDAYSAAVDYFTKHAQSSLLENSGWTYELELNDLKALMDKEVKVLTESQLSKLSNEMKVLFNTSTKSLDRILDDPNEEMWEKIRQLFSTTKQKMSEKFIERLKGFEISEDEATQKIEDLQKVAFEALRDKFKEKSKYLGYVMNKKFEEKFNLDENRLPRRWKPSDNVSDIFLEARKKAELYLEKFALLRMHPDQDKLVYLDGDADVEEGSIIISLDEAHHIKDKFYKDSDSSYKQAIRDQEQIVSTAHIPMYVIVLLLVLGFDEFIHVVSNPLLFVLVASLGVGIYVINLLNMGGPVKRMVEALLHTSLSSFQGYLSEQMHKHNINIPSASSTSASGVGSEPSSPVQDKKRD